MGRLRNLRIEHLLYLAIPYLLLAPLTTVAQQDNYGLIRCDLGLRLVMLSVTVTDANGNPVTNLTRHNFIVTDKNNLQQVEFFSREDRPIGVGIVISTSVSASSKAWFSSISQSLLRFKEQSHEMNEYFIIAAGLSPQLVTDWTRDSDVLTAGLGRLASLDGKNGSAIYDSCALAHEKLGERETLYSTIILISDGRDTASRLTYSDLRESFKRANPLVYSICLEGSGGSLADRGNLKKLSAVSGGAAYVALSAAELWKGLEQTATELRHQYVIGYYPDDVKRDGSWHTVEVMAFAPGQDSQDTGPLVVRSMSGYNAPDKASLTQQEVPRVLK